MRPAPARIGRWFVEGRRRDFSDFVAGLATPSALACNAGLRLALRAHARM
jgi:hypothetical protein